MKLASFLSKHNAVLSIGSLVLAVLLWVSVAFLPSDSLKQLAGALAFVFFALMFVFAFAGYILYSIRNAILRRNGKAATATVLAEKWTGITASNGLRVRRIKLEVHPADEAPFIAVTEDAYDLVYNGQQVAVKYDPHTKEVALEKVKRPKADDDF